MFDEILSVVDFAEVAIVVVAIAASIAVALAIMKGASIVLDMISGHDERYWDGYDDDESEDR